MTRMLAVVGGGIVLLFIVGAILGNFGPVKVGPARFPSFPAQHP